VAPVAPAPTTPDKPTTPTASTAVPTVAPTNVKYSVIVSQTLAGVSYDDYQANKVAYTKSLIATYAQLLSVPTTAIQGLTVSQTTRRTRQLLAAGVAVSFTVASNSVQVTPATVSTTLSNAITSGSLVTTLKTQAANNGASNLAT
jgi:hypothetical protein